MDGIELMDEVCRISPGTSRVIISGIGDQEEIARSLETTHQFLAKPLKPRELRETLTRIGNLDAYLQSDSLRALANKLQSVPSFPSAYLDIMKELNSENPSLQVIADIVTRDAGLTAKMLQVANSAAFGLAERVSGPFDAVQYLGMATARSIALSAHVFASFEKSPIKNFSVKNMWEEAMRCSQMARVIMQLEAADETSTEDACTASLLRETGKLMLVRNLPREFERAVALANSRQIPLTEAETEVLGATHNGVAAYLLGLWGLGAPMVEAVAFHLTPSQSGSRAFGPLTAAHVTKVFSQEMLPSEIVGQPAKLDLAYLTEVGVRDRLDVWREAIAKQFAR
jgi:HD-like signal output (HDOD) protein